MSDVLSRLTTSLESRYRVSREIGAGGMATVYLAHDLRHDRDVAIKVLHPDLAAALGAERFLAEIKTTAKLQHPHILPLLDSGDADGLLYYVMPFVSGESLRVRMERETQLAVDDAVRIAREVLSALESAHKQGVVHRDIKPENILLHEDQALVADFGIALAVSAAGGPRMTQTGLSLGTPQYMAPEQAMGERVIDGRADIYALGAVLYEMLVGEAPFTGPTVQAIVARVMTENPRPVTGQRKSVPMSVNAAVLKSLEKLPADRFHSAAEFSSALTNPGFGTGPLSPDKAEPAKPATRRSMMSFVPWGIAAAATAAALLFAIRGRHTSDDKPSYVSIDIPPGTALAPEYFLPLSISNDGSTMAIGVVARGQEEILLRRLDSDVMHPIEASVGTQGLSAFSPDGKWLVFDANGSLFRVPVNGGPATRLAPASWGHMAFIDDKSLVYTKDYNAGLSRVSADGGKPVVLTTPDRKKHELGHWTPQMLPDGDHVLFTNYITPADKSRIEVLSLSTGKRQLVLDGGYFGRYFNGHLLFVRSGSVYAVAFDPHSFKVSGSPYPIPLDVEVDPPDGIGSFDVSANGTLIYMANIRKQVALTWSDEQGNERTALDSVGAYSAFSVSPDGKKVAVVRDGEVWSFDTQRNLFTRLTHSDQIEKYVSWTPDSREVVFVRDVPQYDIFKVAADGSRAEQVLLTSDHDKTWPSISGDGRTLLYTTDPNGNDDLYALALDSGAAAKPHAVLTGDAQQGRAAFSPDSHWVTYISDESGRREAYLAPWPLDRGPARQQISDNGANFTRWAPDGKTIYYGWSGRIYKVRVNPAAGEIGRPELLSKIQPSGDFVIAPDGRFLIMRLAQSAEQHSVKVVLNWSPIPPDASK